MIKVHPIVLTAALFGHRALSASAAGCHPTYVPDTAYSAEDKVSATTVTETSTTEACSPPGEGSCPASGFATVTTTTSETHNYQCKSGFESAWCNQEGFAPNGVHGGSAWIKESDECSGTAAPVDPEVPAAWSGGGCPVAYALNTVYDAGDVVSVNTTDYTAVFQCGAAPNNLFCGQAGYEPVGSQYGDTVWTELGSCTGTIAPTGSPSFESLPDEGGCPADFDRNAAYDEGDKVSVNGLVYECKAYPLSEHCSQDGYEPGFSISSGGQTLEYWKEAWTVMGFCSGTIAPTGSPSFDVLESVGGCPDEWSAQTYDEGDRVASDGLVFECKIGPASGWCGQDGYEPGTSVGSGAQLTEHWKDAWILVGHCSGSIAPTGSPSFDALTDVGGCPDAWARGSNTAYEEGDMVSVMVSESPERKIAYKCRAWPHSGYCGQFSPTEFGGDQGWTVAGSCDGSTGPTASPSFDALSIDTDGCPEEWSASKTDYEAGDRVAYSVSDSPERKIVYQCREWPNTGYCNQGAAFEPATEYGGMAWTLLGACDGTLAPTAAPIMYAGTCQFDKCLIDGTTEVTCVPGSVDCTCIPTDVEAWSDAVDYVENDEVRVGVARFRCMGWPEFLWCRNEAYRPALEDGIWSQAWTKIEDCPPAAP